MKVKFLKSFGAFSAGDTKDVSNSDASWMLAKKLVEKVEEKTQGFKLEDEFDALFAEEPKQKPKAKIQPSNKAQKAPENK